MKRSLVSIVLFIACIIVSITLSGQQFNSEKWYRFTNKQFGSMRSMALTEQNGVRIITMEATSAHASQYWKIIDIGKNTYRLKNMLSGDNLCIEVKKDHQTYLQMTGIAEDGSQLWKIFDNGNNDLQLVNVGNGGSRALDSYNDRKFAVKNVILSNADAQRTGQHWQIQEMTLPAQLVKPEINGPAGFSKGPDEDGGLSFNFTADVAYGANGSFLYKYGVTGIVTFNNETFGGDPAPGVVKHGFYKQVAAIIPPTPEPLKEVVVEKVTPDKPIPEKPIEKPAENIINIPLPASNQYVRITNKMLGDKLNVDYKIGAKTFSLQQIVHGWKLEPVENSIATQFKILVNVNGKYWALTTDKGANLKLAEISSADGYQYWYIERLANDGYYKISNSVLFNNGSPNAHLFCDQNNKELFLGKWDAARSVNGRWLFNSYGAIPNEIVDEFDNKNLELMSAQIHKPMCCESVIISDYTVPYVIPCTKFQTFGFKKAINGEYLIFVTDKTNTGNKIFYLASNLQLSEQKIDPVEPAREFTWKITKVNDRYYKISSVDGYMELAQGAIFTHIQMRGVAVKVEQMWYFR